MRKVHLFWSRKFMEEKVAVERKRETMSRRINLIGVCAISVLCILLLFASHRFTSNSYTTEYFKPRERNANLRLLNAHKFYGYVDSSPGVRPVEERFRCFGLNRAQYGTGLGERATTEGKVVFWGLGGSFELGWTERHVEGYDVWFYLTEKLSRLLQVDDGMWLVHRHYCSCLLKLAYICLQTDA